MALMQPELQQLEAVACNLCGADDAAELYAARLPCRPARDGRLRCTDSALGEYGRIVRCRRCGFIYTNPREREQAVVDAYEQVDDPTYVAEERGRVETFRRSLRLIHRYRRPPGPLLDVGCYTGLFLRVAREHGWDVTGVEPSRWACGVARDRYGVPAHQGTLSGWAGTGRPFDLITMWDVLEHYTDPLRELRRSAELMAPQGVLALTTIDIGSPIARLLGKRWWWLMEMHLYYFTRRTVTELLRRAGFEVLGIHTHVRVITVRYLWTRLAPWLGGVARSGSRVSWWLGMHPRCVPVVLGDLMTVVARRMA